METQKQGIIPEFVEMFKTIDECRTALLKKKIATLEEENERFKKIYIEPMTHGIYVPIDRHNEICAEYEKLKEVNEKTENDRDLFKKSYKYARGELAKSQAKIVEMEHEAEISTKIIMELIEAVTGEESQNTSVVIGQIKL